MASLNTINEKKHSFMLDNYVSIIIHQYEIVTNSNGMRVNLWIKDRIQGSHTSRSL